MPGTVQVSILELKELPSSQSSSSMSITVSLGKNTYEAEGQKGDFLFPLATFRDNLVVKVHDNKGNEIAHTGVKSRLIAEKGYWDDEFPLEGGGQIRMKLKFSLSEDERNRIRNMRESALRKKKEELLNKKMLVVVASSGGGNEMPPRAAIDLSLEAASKVVIFKSTNIPVNTSSYSLKEQTPQEKTDEQHYNLKERILLEKTSPSRLKEDDQPYELKEQSPVDKIPSRLEEDGKPLVLKDKKALKKTPSKLDEVDQPYKLKDENLVKEKPSELEGGDQPYSLIEQSKMEETTSEIQEHNQGYSRKEHVKPSKLEENDQPCNLEDQSPLEETSSRRKEDGEPVSLKDQSALEKTTGKLQEGDQPYSVQEQNKVEETPIKIQEDDQPYSTKEQSKTEETPSKLQEDDQPCNIKVQSQLENTVSKLQEDDQPDKCKEERSLEKIPSKVKDGDQRYIEEQSSSETTPSKVNDEDQRFKLKIPAPLEATPSKIKDEDRCFHLKKPTPLEANPNKAEDNDRHYKYQVEKTSSRIRETIAAFESSPVTKGRTNTVKVQSSREQKTFILDESEPIETKYIDNVEYKSKEVIVEKEPKEKIPLHNIHQSMENSKELCQPSGLEETEPSISVTEQDNANDRMDAEVSGRIRQCPCNSYRGWIFLEEAVCTCIVGDNRMVIDLHEDHIVDRETCPGKIDNEEVTSSEENKLPDVAKKPDSGPHGQIMKIVIVVGFGLLVLFTRSQKSR